MLRVSIPCARNGYQSVLKRTFRSGRFQRSLYEEQVAPAAKKPSLLRKVAKYTLIFAATGTSVFLLAGVYSLYGSILARKYVTAEDMHEYRSMDRNMLVDFTMDEMEEELLDCAIDVDEQIYELMEEREPLISAEERNKFAAEAKADTKHLLKEAIFGNDLERRRAWNDHYSFYCTYIELDELQKIREDGHEWGTKEEQNRWR